MSAVEGRAEIRRSLLEVCFGPISDVGIAGHRSTIMLYSHSISPSMGATLSGEHVERRLAAILAADVAGSCRLIGIDEEGTLAFWNPPSGEARRWWTRPRQQPALSSGGVSRRRRQR